MMGCCGGTVDVDGDWSSELEMVGYLVAGDG
jgi:hypothetical protein